MITNNVSTLKIHKLTQEQYDRELASGNIDQTALYLTPDDTLDSAKEYIDFVANGKADLEHNHDSEYDSLGSAQEALDLAKEYTNSIASGKANTEHTHDIEDINGLQITLDSKSDISHNHDSAYDTKGAANSALESAKTYTDSAIETEVTNRNSAIATAKDSAISTASSDAKTKADSALASAKSYTDSKVSNLASTTVVDNKISSHNTSTSAHSDIRALITALTTKVTNFLDVDDTTTDQLSEVLTLIENNKGTLESLTTSKINVSDIVNNLTTNSTSKVLSAAQGVAIKTLIDALTEVVNSKSDSGHTHDGRYYTESEIDSKLSGKANTSHGNHVPTTETANNAKFLRNDNTWATVTPANIGAAASSHGTHVSYSSTAPVMDGTASVGSASTVARSDHKHPTDTSRASQTDLDALETVVAGKADKSHTHTIANVTNLQSSLDAKQATITGAASTVTSSNLTASRALISNSSGKVAVSDVTSTELGYLDGVTSNVQTQLNAKQPKEATTFSLHGDQYVSVRTPDRKAGQYYEFWDSGDIGWADIRAGKFVASTGFEGNLTGNVDGTNGVFSNRVTVHNTYDLGSFYDYGNGCLIDICGSGLSTMVAIEISGNGYNTQKPIHSIYQFYDYTSSDTIIQSGARNFGLALGAMTVYRYNGRLYAHIKQTASFQTLSFRLYSNKSGLIPSVTNSAAHTSGYTNLITITPDNVAISGHTHSIANITNLQSTLDGKAASSHTHTIANITNLQSTLDGKAASSHNHAATNITSGTLSSDRLPTVPVSKGGTGATDAATARTNLGLGSAATMNGTTTITSGGTGLITSGAVYTGLAGKANSSHTHNYAGSSSAGGSATSAVKLDSSAGDANTPVYFSSGKPVACTSLDLNTTGSAAKLTTARTIALGTGATGTATSFDGSANITIPVTDVKEAYLSWGGKNFSGSYAPIDAAMIPNLGANRLAFMPASGVTVEYSTDGGSTWSAYSSFTNNNKIDLFNGNGANMYIGASSATKIDKTKYMCRVTIETSTAQVYTALNKFIIYCSTAGSTGSYCTIEARTQANYSAGTNTWAKFADKVSISGWSGYNVINTSAITTYGNSDSHYRQLRFTFGVTSHASTVTYSGLVISKIMGFGGVGWTTPSTMAATGRMYTYDASKNVTFPAGVTATTFTGALSGNATTATTASAVAWSGITSKPSYYDAKAIKGITRSGTTFTYTCMDGTTGTFTQQDNNTTYSSLKNPYSLTVQGNGTSSFTYDGSAAKTLNIKPGSNVSVSSDTSGNITIAATNTTYSAATTSAAGLMSAADKTKLDGITASADTVSFSRSLTSGTKIGTITINGTATDLYCQTNTNTTYSNFVKSGSSAAAGLVPAPSTTAGTTKYLREDGTWQVPPDTNTTYSAATTSANGLMTAAMVTKLNGIAEGANKYTLPTAGSSLGGVKTTSTVTSTSGYTACPIISGVPYYKDTNTTYSAATTSANGLMSSADKSKLDNISYYATSNSFTSEFSSGTLIGNFIKNTYTMSGGKLNQTIEKLPVYIPNAIGYPDYANRSIAINSSTSPENAYKATTDGFIQLWLPANSSTKLIKLKIADTIIGDLPIGCYYSQLFPIKSGQTFIYTNSAASVHSVYFYPLA